MNDLEERRSEHEGGQRRAYRADALMVLGERS